MVDDFYMVYRHRYPEDLLWFIEYYEVPILTNAKERWSKHTDSFKEMYGYDTRRVIDAGGFGILATHGEYPWEVEEYHEWLEENSDKFEWACGMDFACEDALSHVGTVEERVDWTVENTTKQWNMDRSYKLLPVIQGQTVEEYVDCAERLEDAGVDISHVGLGSVCRRSQTQEIVDLVGGIRENTNIENVHGFGTKMTALRYDVEFETMDSAAWSHEPQNGQIHQPVLDENDEHAGYERVDSDDPSRVKYCVSFETYYAQMTEMMNGEPAIDPVDIIKRWKHETMTEPQMF